MEAICPIVVVGYPPGWLPIHVKMMIVETKVQKVVCEAGRKAIERWLERWRAGINVRMKIEADSASTPPSLFGMERRIA